MERNSKISKLMILCWLAVGASIFSGCDSTRFSQETAERAVMVAKYTARPIQVDGVLDEPIWSSAIAYPLNLSTDKIANGKTLEEPGSVQLAWDDNYFYIAVTYQDSDLIAQSNENQVHHYKYGDLAELFLKPENSTWYWELYATPNSNKTSFFFPGRGYLGLPSIEDYNSGLQVAAQTQGTLNNWHDHDQSWTAEMAMPISELTAFGDSFTGSQWNIFVARYNYGRYLENPELSMTPSLPATSYHLHEDYARLELVR